MNQYKLKLARDETMVFVSMGLRLRVEVEALNMVEALGAYTRHRTVAILRKITRDGVPIYRIVTVPAISGQSIANGYMRVLVELAKHYKLEVCDECSEYEKRGGFTKHGTFKEKIEHDYLVKKCIVEDLTGFMVPEAQIRRTSPVMFSYMAPDLEGAKATIESQFHVRYDFTSQKHQPFNIESGTAIYMLLIGIDVSRIGKLENGGYVDNRLKRIEVALKGIGVLLESFSFGAKKSRYLPVEEIVGAIVAVSNPIPFMVSPPRVHPDRNYIKDTLLRAKKYSEMLSDLNEKIYIVYLDKEGLKVDIDIDPKGSKDGINVVRVETFSELIEKVWETVRNIVTQ